MIVLARESRGITQLDLASKIAMSKANMSKIENGDIGVSSQTMELIASVTDYPISFFKQRGEIYPDNLTYRKREKVAQKLLTPLNAKVNIVRINMQFLLNTLHIPNPAIPQFQVNVDNTPASIARKVRKAWNLTDPIIENTITLLEEKGIAVTGFPFDTERVDSRCILTENKYPVIIFNNALNGDRQRFSLIYQLAHLVMHSSGEINWDRDVINEANLFTAEFLMPEKYIKKDFENGITLPLLGALKRKWKVSMIALLYRADDLGYLTANQKKYLIQQFNEQKMRRREPLELDVPIEKPIMVSRWVNDLQKKRQLDVKGVASLFHLNTYEFASLYN